MPRFPHLKERLAALPKDPTASELRPLAEEIASRCRAARCPRKSVAAVLRHIRPKLPDATGSALEECVWEAFDSTATAGVKPQSEGESHQRWPGIATVSYARGVSARTLAEQLRFVRYRHLYGWPWWDGHRWCFNPAIIDPMLCARYMAELPDEEPAPYLAMLPEWCHRVDPEPGDSPDGP